MVETWDEVRHVQPQLLFEETPADAGLSQL